MLPLNLRFQMLPIMLPMGSIYIYKDNKNAEPETVTQLLLEPTCQSPKEHDPYSTCIETSFFKAKKFSSEKKNTSLPCVYRSPNFIRLNPGTQGFQLLILIFPYHILRRSPPRWWAMDGDFPWAVSDPPGVVFQEVKSNDARQQQRKNDGPNEFWMKHLRKSQ